MLCIVGKGFIPRVFQIALTGEGGTRNFPGGGGGFAQGFFFFDLLRLFLCTN